MWKGKIMQSCGSVGKAQESTRGRAFVTDETLPESVAEKNQLEHRTQSQRFLWKSAFSPVQLCHLQPNDEGHEP